MSYVTCSCCGELVILDPVIAKLWDDGVVRFLCEPCNGFGLRVARPGGNSPASAKPPGEGSTGDHPSRVSRAE